MALLNKKGSALAYVLVALVVTGIFVAIVSNYFSNNLRQAQAQEYNVKAYYLAQSGIDLAWSALMLGTEIDENDYLYKSHFALSNPTPAALEETIDLDSGTIQLTITALEINSSRWIEIVSEATLYQTGTKKAISLKFEYDNPSNRSVD